MSRHDLHANLAHDLLPERPIVLQTVSVGAAPDDAEPGCPKLVLQAPLVGSLEDDEAVIAGLLDPGSSRDQSSVSVSRPAMVPRADASPTDTRTSCPCLCKLR